MNDPHLLLWLEGPIQAWGVNAKFNKRTTLDFPSRSAVMGIVCAALGASGEQRELLALFAPLSQTIIAYGRRGANKEAVPAPLQLRDFHMVGSAFDSKDPWQTLHIPKKSDHTAAVGGGTKLTYRYYLQEAAFAAILTVPQSLCDTLHAALTTPFWDISLGRKCCVPTEFVYQGLYPDATAAFERAAALAEEKERTERYRVMEGEHDGERFLLPDLPLCFGTKKQYGERLVTLVCV